MYSLICNVGIVIAMAFLALAEFHREQQGKSVRRVRYSLIGLTAFGAIVSAVAGYMSDRENEWLAKSREESDKERQRVAALKGEIHSPTIGEYSDTWELVLGNNTLLCSARYTIDLARIVTTLGPCPLVSEGPYLKVTTRDGRLAVSATLNDEKGQIGILSDNEFLFETKRRLTVTSEPNRVVVCDEDGTTLLDVTLNTARRVTVHGIFYTDNYRCVVDEEGIQCKARSKDVPFQNIVISGNRLRFGS